MSVRSLALRELVAQRLAAAAEEIFALFERTFAEYEQECQRAVTFQEPRLTEAEGCSQDLDDPNLLVQTEVDLDLERVKFEEKEIPLEAQFSPVAVKSEAHVDKCSFLPREPSEELELEPEPELCDADDAGCSLDLNIKEFEPCRYSDTDHSDDWTLHERRQEPDGLSSSIYHLQPEQQDFTEEGSCFQSEQLQTEPFSDGKDKPFSCGVCSKSFPQKRILKAHMRIHTGEKPYHCKPCGLSFRFQQNYFQHDLAVHRKDKPFRCRVCKADFVHKLEMIAHRNTHDMKSVTCSTCSKVFNSARYLRRHMERCPRKKRRGSRADALQAPLYSHSTALQAPLYPQSAARTDTLQAPLYPHSATQQDGQRFESRGMLDTSVNQWL